MIKSYFKSVNFQNFIRIAFIILLSFIVLGISIMGISYRFVINDRRKSMSATADEVSRIVAAYSYSWDMRSFEVRMALSTTENISGFQVAVCDARGTIVSTSEQNMYSNYIGKAVPQIVMDEINATGEYGDASDLGGLYDKQHYIVGRAIPSPVTGDTAGYVILSGDIESMSSLWRSFAVAFSRMCALVLIILFVVTYYVTNRQSMAINEMAAAAHRFARGDFDVRVDTTDRDDEIGDLAAAFNLMADSIQSSENRRREFIANVSHELKTPMTTITGFTDGILDGTIPTEKQEKYLKVISSETKRLSRLVKGMLDMSQYQAMDAVKLLSGRLDIAEVIRLTILSLEKKLDGRGLSVNAVLPEEPVIIKGDEDAITQVVYNLLDNAIKFSEPNGEVKVELWKKGSKAYVSIENRGVTIAPDELDLIFDRFHKSDRSRSIDREGVGLGLYIVKTILDNHNENIFVTSRDGVTKFVFTLALGAE